MADEELKSQVDAYVDEVWEDVVADIASLVRFESVEDLSKAAPGAPFGPAPKAALECAEAMAARLGLDVHDMDGYLGYGDLAGASDTVIATIAHTDIVPLGQGWNFPPLELTRKDGYLIGRGVMDDKGPFVLSLYAAHFFAREVERTGRPLPYTLRCIIGSNEETGMADVPVYLERFGDPRFLFTPDADFPAICGEKGIYHGRFTSAPIEPGNIVELEAGTAPNVIPGLAHAVVRGDAMDFPEAEDIMVSPECDGLARIDAVGKGGHASMPAGTLNAIDVLVRYLMANVELNESERTFLELSQVLTASTDASSLGFASADDIFGPTTCISGTIRYEGGRMSETIDSRHSTEVTGSQITELCQALAASHGATFEVMSDEPNFYIDPDSPEFAALLSTYAEYTGKDATPMVIGGGTYARHFGRACAFGPNEEDAVSPDWVGTEHAPDEGIAEETLRRALKIYIVSIARLMRLEL